MRKVFRALIVISVLLSANAALAENIYLEDFDFTANDVQGSEFLSARWGTWNGTQFVQAITNSSNSGFLDVNSPEIGVLLSQTDNNVYAQGTQLALAFFTDGSNDAQALNWSSATHAVVLVDSSWIAPVFNNNGTQVTFSFTASTSAVLGSYSFNSGNETIGLAAIGAIPEPSTFGVLFGLSALGMVACRRGKRV